MSCQRPAAPAKDLAFIRNLLSTIGKKAISSGSPFSLTIFKIVLKYG